MEREREKGSKSWKKQKEKEKEQFLNKRIFFCCCCAVNARFTNWFTSLECEYVQSQLSICNVIPWKSIKQMPIYTMCMQHACIDTRQTLSERISQEHTHARNVHTPEHCYIFKKKLYLHHKLFRCYEQNGNFQSKWFRCFWQVPFMSAVALCINFIFSYIFFCISFYAQIFSFARQLFSRCFCRLLRALAPSSPSPHQQTLFLSFSSNLFLLLFLLILLLVRRVEFHRKNPKNIENMKEKAVYTIFAQFNAIHMNPCAFTLFLELHFIIHLCESRSATYAETERKRTA